MQTEKIETTPPCAAIEPAARGEEGEMTHADAVARLMGIMRSRCVKSRRDIAALNMAINQLVRRDRQTGQHYLNRAARNAAANEEECK